MNKKLLGLLMIILFAIIGFSTVRGSQNANNMMNNPVQASKVTNAKQAVKLVDQRYGNDDWRCYGNQRNGYMTKDNKGRVCYWVQGKSGQNKDGYYVYPNGKMMPHDNANYQGRMGC